MDRRNPFQPDNGETFRAWDRRLRTQSIRESWPLLILVPVLQGIVYAASWSILIVLFLGEDFGLSQGHDYPWPGGVAIVFVLSFWTNRFLGGRMKPGALPSAISIVAWLATILGWIAIDPAYRDSAIWSRPEELVQSEGYLIPVILMSMVLWWLGSNYADLISSIAPEDERFIVQRAWIVLVASIVLALAIGGNMGRSAVETSRIAVPLLLVTSLALVAGAEVESTRRLASWRGGQPPSWTRWLRMVGGLTVGVFLLTVIVLAIFGPETIGAIIDALVWLGRWVGLALGYVLFAVVWCVFQLFNAMGSLLNALFGDMIEPITMPPQPNMGRDPFENMRNQGEPGPFKYAIAMRWGLLGLVIAVGLLVLFRIRNRSNRPADDEGLEEYRDSVFSSDLARQQLRDLFRRRPRQEHAPPLDLATTPGSVRETMMYLETLATRQQAARRNGETATDFTARLRAVWPGVSPQMIDLARLYGDVRYGETDDPPDPETLSRAQRAWTEIWTRRKDWVPPPPPVDEKESSSKKRKG